MNTIHHKVELKQLLMIGWREWCALPKLHIPLIRAKIDTGAKTSAIHAFNIKALRRLGKEYVRFCLHPIHGSNKVVVNCVAEVVDERLIMSSNGHKEHRFVIKTPLKIGERQWDIELTLSNRDPLRFRILLGRSALQGRVIINPSHSFCVDRYTKQAQLRLYHQKYVKKTQ